jgi:hypothetical protein
MEAILFYSSEINKPQNEPVNLVDTHGGRKIEITIGHLSFAEFRIWQLDRSLLNMIRPVTAMSL